MGARQGHGQDPIPPPIRKDCMEHCRNSDRWKVSVYHMQLEFIYPVRASGMKAKMIVGVQGTILEIVCNPPPGMRSESLRV
jgi:hypothetical protein